MLKYLEEAGEAMVLAEQGNRELAKLVMNYARRLWADMHAAAAGVTIPAART